jgi:hypothetical protein
MITEMNFIGKKESDVVDCLFPYRIKFALKLQMHMMGQGNI